MRGVFVGSLALAFLGAAKADDQNQILTSYDVQVLTQEILVTTRIPHYVTLTDSDGAPTATVVTDGTLPTSAATSAKGAVTKAASTPLTTSTLTSTILETITSCSSNPKCTNGQVVTRTTVYTTVCPVTQSGDSTVWVASTKTLNPTGRVGSSIHHSAGHNSTRTKHHHSGTAGSTGKTSLRSHTTGHARFSNSSSIAKVTLSETSTKHAVTTIKHTETATAHSGTAEHTRTPGHTKSFEHSGSAEHSGTAKHHSGTAEHSGSVKHSKTSIALGEATSSDSRPSTGLRTGVKTGVVVPTSSRPGDVDGPTGVPCVATDVEGGLFPSRGLPVKSGARVTVEGTVYHFAANATGAIQFIHARPSGRIGTPPHNVTTHRGFPGSTGFPRRPTTLKTVSHRPIPTPLQD